MIVVLPFCNADVAQAYALLEWIDHMGGVRGHDCLLVTDNGVNWDDAVRLLCVANDCFFRADLVSTEATITGWPDGPNALWLEAARFASQADKPFLWLEPDAFPLVVGWLDKIATQYSSSPEGTYLGYVYKTNNPKFPDQVMSGVGVYPAQAITLIEPAMASAPARAWDIAAAPAMAPFWRHTRLIHHFWGEAKLAPTFVGERSNGDPVNAFTLADIDKEAVIFHRNKDGTLLDLLRGPKSIVGENRLVVVLPICNSDANLMCKTLEWMASMNMPRTHECLVSSDRLTQPVALRRVLQLAKVPFLKVHQTTYTMPKKALFPQTAAWHHAARTMAQLNRNWLWLEADCIPLKPNWLLAMQAEYDRCRKAFCGPVMHGRGHMNGTAIYPADTPRRLPKTMTVLSNAWDVEAQVEMGNNVHDCTRLWQCAWGVVRGKLNPIEGEELPGFPKGNPIINQIRPEAVLFHRDKSGSLIDRLRERLK